MIDWNSPTAMWLNDSGIPENITHDMTDEQIAEYMCVLKTARDDLPDDFNDDEAIQVLHTFRQDDQDRLRALMALKTTGRINATVTLELELDLTDTSVPTNIWRAVWAKMCGHGYAAESATDAEFRGTFEDIFTDMLFAYWTPGTMPESENWQIDDWDFDNLSFTERNT